MAAGKKQSAGSRKVLVVDDDPQLREVLVEALSDQGYEVAAAESGEQALEILAREKIHVQLIDLQLPGINGIDLCRKLSDMDPVAQRIAMTAYVSVFNLVESREAGFDDYFVKPFTVQLILDSVEVAFGKVERWMQGR